MKTANIKHKIDRNTSKLNCIVQIRLNDENKNGYQDFSLTGTFWKPKRIRDDKNLIAGGCCHEEILKHFPELQIFADLHLADYTGVPMYAVENGFYHLKHGFNRTQRDAPEFAAEFAKYYRMTPEQFEVISKSETRLQYAINIKELGILDQWHKQAQEAIATLEKMTGLEFEVNSTKTQFNMPEKYIAVKLD